MLEASAFFAEANRHVLRDPRVHAVVADGRNFLFTTARRYDVISSEPSNPWIGGLASLFSEEFFRAAQGRLRPGGIMIQWIHGYSMRDADLRMVVMDVPPFCTAQGDRAELAGVNESIVEQARRRAHRERLEGWVLTLDQPTYVAVVTDAESQTLRAVYAYIAGRFG